LLHHELETALIDFCQPAKRGRNDLCRARLESIRAISPNNAPLVALSTTLSPTSTSAVPSSQHIHAIRLIAFVEERVSLFQDHRLRIMVEQISRVSSKPYPRNRDRKRQVTIV
jgi:hypothetical protein